MPLLLQGGLSACDLGFFLHATRGLFFSSTWNLRGLHIFNHSLQPGSGPEPLVPYTQRAVCQAVTSGGSSVNPSPEGLFTVFSLGPSAGVK